MFNIVALSHALSCETHPFRASQRGLVLVQCFEAVESSVEAGTLLKKIMFWREVPLKCLVS